VLPWGSGEFDLAIAYMSLHDMADPGTVIAEIGRVLEPGTTLCLAIIHPLNRPPDHLENYFEEQRFAEKVSRNGLSMTFVGVDRPLESYTGALSAAGFVIEELREPRPSAADVKRTSELSLAARKPYFLHLRCRLGIRVARDFP
jgi:SAM-dependent methyltransferase